MSDQITRKVLMKESNAPYWVITHLTLSGRLPLVREATGKGSVNIYDSTAIQILKDWMEKKGKVRV